MEGTIPTDPTSGYSHINLDDLDGFTEDAVEEVRFYCTTSHTSRVIHFKTGNAFQAGVAFDGSLAGNAASYWNSGYTLLDGHTAYLPGSTAHVYTGISYGFWNFPFWVSGSYHWGIRGIGSRWECDDIAVNTASGYQYTTLHQVWVRGSVVL